MQMAMNEMEFLGYDRYFKYRYTQETQINFTSITETWNMKNHASWYKITEEYLKRSLNLKVLFEEHKIAYKDITKLYIQPDFFNNASVIMVPTRLSSFNGLQEYFGPSPVFETARTIIVSASPKRVLSTSLSFLNMDTKVVILTLITVVLLSLLLFIHSIVTNEYQTLSTKKWIKKLAKEFIGNVWDNAALMCAEPIPAIIPHITCRLLAMSWIIGVTLILFFMGCFLRTEFTMESYNCIDTLSDLIKSGIKPTMIKQSGTLDHLKYLAAQDQLVKEWLSTLDEEKLFSTLKDYMTLDGYIPILKGEKALITVDTYLTWMMGESLAHDSESKEFLMSEGGLYFSQYAVDFEYLHFICNTSWMRSTPQVHENIQLSLVPVFETQVFKYLELKLHHYIEQIKWKRPLKSTADLDLSKAIVPFYLLFMLLSGTVVIVITEIFFNSFY